MTGPSPARPSPVHLSRVDHRALDPPIWGFGAMDATKPYKFIGLGAMDVTKPNKFIGFGAMDATKPYKSLGFGAVYVTKPYKCIGFGAMDVTKPYKCIGFVRYGFSCGPLGREAPQKAAPKPSNVAQSQENPISVGQASGSSHSGGSAISVRVISPVTPALQICLAAFFAADLLAPKSRLASTDRRTICRSKST